MDSKGNQTQRSFKRGSACEGRRENPSIKNKKSRTRKKPAFEKESAAREHAWQIAKEKMTTQFKYKPVREHLMVIVDYIKIMEMSKTSNPLAHITMLVSLIEHLKKQLEICLKYEMFKEGKKNDRSVAI